MEALQPGPQPACEVSHRGSDRGVPRQRTPPTDGVSVRLPWDRPAGKRAGSSRFRAARRPSTSCATRWPPAHALKSPCARRGPFSPWPGVPESIPCHRIFPEGVPMRVRLTVVALSLALSFTASAASAPGGPSKMLTDPALSAERIAFVYGNDVWTCRLDGRGVQRITSGSGVKMRPAFSPDGSLLAFSAELDGNLDVYVVPAAGGVPKRLTWHPGRDVVQGFTPDGKSVLFTSPRAADNNRHAQLYTVPVEGGPETALPIPYASRAAYSPDGKTIAYNPNNPAHLQWKRYRGGLVSKVWLFDVASNAIARVPCPPKRATPATSRTRPPRTSARPPGRRTARRSPTSPMRAARTSSSSARRTARARRGKSRFPARASTTSSSSLPTAGRSS